jgi:hypothetical protein
MAADKAPPARIVITAVLASRRFTSRWAVVITPGELPSAPSGEAE